MSTSSNSPASREEILETVCRALDLLCLAGTDHGGLFPSVMDRSEGKMLSFQTQNITGQRQGDRCHLGSNLIHDESTLLTLYGLADALGRNQYAEAADRYLRFFAEKCASTETGLFPWGEHAFWHLTEHRVGSSRETTNDEARGHAIHDHLRQAPGWLWQKLNAFNPACVQTFSDGLEYHWTVGERREYIRHVHIEERQYLKQGNRSCDFPRHGGFYIFDWTVAYTYSDRGELLNRIREMMDYWWKMKDHRNLLLIESRSPESDTKFYNVNAPGQTLSLAASLLESAQMLEKRQSELCQEMRRRASAYIDGFFEAPHVPEDGVFVILSRRDDNSVAQSMPVWGSVYGVWPASYPALTALCAYRLTNENRLLDWAISVGEAYLQIPFPADTAVPAMDVGSGLGLLADLYDLTGERKWMDGFQKLAGILLGRYCDQSLPRGAAGIDWYESQMGPGFLLHALARGALLGEDRTACRLSADYTAR